MTCETFCAPSGPRHLRLDTASLKNFLLCSLVSALAWFSAVCQLRALSGLVFMGPVVLSLGHMLIQNGSSESNKSMHQRLRTSAACRPLLVAVYDLQQDAWL